MTTADGCGQQCAVCRCYYDGPSDAPCEMCRLMAALEKPLYEITVTFRPPPTVPDIPTT